MPKAKLQAATVGGSAHDVEAQFYEALQTGDLEKLMACWADEDDIVCVHPGGPRLVGNAQIRAAFETMFNNGTIAATPERVCKVDSLTSAMHNVIERISIQTPEGMQYALVVATNVYQRTAQGWRMVAHHASPGTSAAHAEAQETPQVLH
ncbi:MAG: YybH family protein [Limnohabitans sp.]|jgi:ketosteroid isomerase-like protein